MAKKIKYTNGDIFCIELDNNYKGYGRVIKKDYSLVFIELYKLKTKEEVIEIDKFLNIKVILAIWSIDDSLKSGEWKIVGNIPVDSDYKMPYFWRKSPMTGNIFLFEPKDTFDELVDGVIITEDQIGDAQPATISGDVAVKLKLIHMLNELENTKE